MFTFPDYFKNAALLLKFSIGWLLKLILHFITQSHLDYQPNSFYIFPLMFFNLFLPLDQLLLFLDVL